MMYSHFWTALVMVPFALQILAMGIDEFYYHWRRGLPKWEVFGHPLDTVTVLFTLGVAAFFPWSEVHLMLFVGAGAFSSIFITKDEVMHRDVSSLGEMWLHGVLFVLHPMIFLATAILWYARDLRLPWLMFSADTIGMMLMGQWFAVLAFNIYQITYWGLYVQRTDQQ